MNSSVKIRKTFCKEKTLKHTTTSYLLAENNNEIRSAQFARKKRQTRQLRSFLRILLAQARATSVLKSVAVAMIMKLWSEQLFGINSHYFITSSLLLNSLYL